MRNNRDHSVAIATTAPFFSVLLVLQVVISNLDLKLERLRNEGLLAELP